MIALGRWVDPRPPQPSGAQLTFQQYASDWFAAKSREVSERRRADLRWRLTKHLIPFFGPRKAPRPPPSSHRYQPEP
jgi:hypothetical protein